jgi:hypothetical protein
MASSLISVLAVTTPGTDTPPKPVTGSERGGLLDAVRLVPDRRNPRGIRYPLAALLTVAVCAVLAGASSFAAITDWLYDLDESAQVGLGFTRGVPAGTTVWRLLTRLDAGLVTAVLAGWLQSRARPVPSRARRYRTVIAVDGKTLRGARLPEGRQVPLLAALDTSTGIVLAQVTVDTKSNEIPAFTPLLDAVEMVLGTLTGVPVRRRRTAHPDRSRPADHHPRSAPVTPGQGQPAHAAHPAQGSALGADPGRGPHPRSRPRPQRDPHRQSRHPAHPGRHRVPARPASRPDHPHPHHGGQDQPRDRLPDHIAARRGRPTG